MTHLRVRWPTPARRPDPALQRAGRRSLRDPEGRGLPRRPRPAGRPGEAMGSTLLGSEPVPVLAEIAAQPEFTPEVIGAATFETVWWAAGQDAPAAAFVSGSRSGSATRRVRTGYCRTSCTTWFTRCLFPTSALGISSTYPTMRPRTAIASRVRGRRGDGVRFRRRRRVVRVEWHKERRLPAQGASVAAPDVGQVIDFLRDEISKQV